MSRSTWDTQLSERLVAQISSKLVAGALLLLREKNEYSASALVGS
jgi:hypothetical protein